MKRIIKEMFGELEPTGKFWMYLGFVTLLCAALMSWDFGRAISYKHAFFLLCLTVVFAFLPDTAVHQWLKGRRNMALVLGFLAVPVGILEFYTHAGYTAGLRGVNTSEAKVQNVKWKGNQDAVSQEATDLKRWEARLADMTSQNAWVTSVTSEALEAKLVSAELAINLEARRGGCKARCLERTRERDEIKSQMALAAERKDLEEKIEAVKRVLAKARDTANATEFKASAVELQDRFLGSLVALVSSGGETLEPSDLVAAGTEKSVALGMALAGTGLPALAFVLAGLYRRQERAGHVPHPSSGVAATALVPGSPAVAAAPVEIRTRHGQSGNSLSVIRETISDARTAQLIADATAPFRAKFA